MDQQTRTMVLVCIGLSLITMIFLVIAVALGNDAAASVVLVVFMALGLTALLATMKHQAVRSMLLSPPKVVLDEAGVESIEWADQNGFEPIGKYVVEIDTKSAPLAPPAVSIELWESGDGTHLVRNRTHKLEVIYFSTVFGAERRICITTSNSHNSQNFPARPGCFVETFHKSSLEDLLNQHRESIAFIRRRLGVYAVEPLIDVVRRVRDEAREEALYIMSIDRWQVRSIGWELRNTKYNRVPIAERYKELDSRELCRQMDEWKTKKAEVLLQFNKANHSLQELVEGEGR